MSPAALEWHTATGARIPAPAAGYPTGDFAGRASVSGWTKTANGFGYDTAQGAASLALVDVGKLGEAFGPGAEAALPVTAGREITVGAELALHPDFVGTAPPATPESEQYLSAGQRAGWYSSAGSVSGDATILTVAHNNVGSVSLHRPFFVEHNTFSLGGWINVPGAGAVNVTLVFYDAEGNYAGWETTSFTADGWHGYGIVDAEAPANATAGEILIALPDGKANGVQLTSTSLVGTGPRSGAGPAPEVPGLVPRLGIRFYDDRGQTLTTYGVELDPIRSPTYENRTATTTVPAGAAYAAATVGGRARYGVDVLLIRRVTLAAAGTAAGGSWHYAVDPALTAALVAHSTSYGRRAPAGPAEPLTTTVTLAAAAAPPPVGTRFQLRVGAHLIPAGSADRAVRFTGEVTDVVRDPRSGTYTVVAAGTHGRASRTPVTLPAVQRGDSTAAAEVAAAIGQHLARYPTPSTRPRVRGSGTPEPAGSLLTKIAAGGNAPIVETRLGALDMLPVENRAAWPAATLSADHLLTGLQWAQRSAEVENVVSVNLPGRDPVVVRDEPSVTARGEFPATVDTLLTDPLEAEALALVRVARNRRPVWRPSGAVVDLLHSPAAVPRGVLLDAAVGTRLRLEQIPGPDAAPVSLDVFVEGYTETMHLAPGRTPLDESTRRLTWRLSLVLSDARLGGAALTWSDLPTSLRWADVPAGVDWLAAAQATTPDDLTT